MTSIKHLSVKDVHHLSDKNKDSIEIVQLSRNGSLSESENDEEEPNTQSALVITSFDEPLKLSKIPIPKLNDHDILVQNKAIGLNPIDWKAKKYRFGVYSFPWINGRESSGVVVKLGSKVSNFEINDSVIVSSTSYRDNRTSTFQEYTAIDSRLVWKLPKFLSYEDGATLGVGLVTAGTILNKSFDLSLVASEANKGKTLIIWGGSTVVGIYVTQLAKIIGLNVISISTIDHKEYLLTLGADKVIDRNLETKELIEHIPDKIHFAVDCISKETSLKLIDILVNKSVFSDHKPLFSGIVGIPKDVPSSIEVKEVIIKQFHEDIEYGSKFVQVTSELLHAKKLIPIRFKHFNDGGLDSITSGLTDLELTGAKAEKYVVSLK
ncbi:probable quinone oxidoreductase [[Candida] railenensis]|uniref:Probable quinone oxidoreductase n=1 Tax=[Candida] railenensis TaxID=45579 RepID=A0A9P0QMG1_9ASCO|nr:probable quinone oxidoreductase [[Candida] railenensis]